MASMMGGDFVDAYVLRNAYKEKMRRMDEAEAEAAAAAQGKNGKEGAAAGPAGDKKAAAEGKNGKGGFFGLIKKKVHPKAPASSS